MGMNDTECNSHKVQYSTYRKAKTNTVKY
jgi:hypothetical protein